MKLHVINSGSSGNCYILKSRSGQMLMIDCGVRWSEIQKAIDFKYNNVVACLLTHEHGDHSKSVKNVIEKSIKLYSLSSTAKNLGVDQTSHFTPAITSSITSFGEFVVAPFSLHHDVPTLGFIIQHEECGQIIFATDTNQLNYLFPEANHYIIEANYCRYVLADRKMKDVGNSYVSDRVEKSHLSIQQALHTLSINNLDNVHTITLIHLSDANSDEGRFRDLVVAQTGKPCYIAKKNVIVDLNIGWDG